MTKGRVLRIYHNRAVFENIDTGNCLLVTQIKDKDSITSMRDLRVCRTSDLPDCGRCHHVIPIEAIFGTYDLFSCSYVAVVIESSPFLSHTNISIRLATKIRILPLFNNIKLLSEPKQADEDYYIALLQQGFDSHEFFFSLTHDITHTQQRIFTILNSSIYSNSNNSNNNTTTTTTTTNSSNDNNNNSNNDNHSSSSSSSSSNSNSTKIGIVGRGNVGIDTHDNSGSVIKRAISPTTFTSTSNSNSNSNSNNNNSNNNNNNNSNNNNTTSVTNDTNGMQRNTSGSPNTTINNASTLLTHTTDDTVIRPIIQSNSLFLWKRADHRFFWNLVS